MIPLRSLILASALWGVCPPLLALRGQTPASAAELDARHVLRAAAQSGTLAGLRWPRFPYYRDELTSLYTPSDWRPVWTANGVPITAARQAIDVLRAAQDRGLHPEDYDVALLDQEYRKLASGAPSSASEVGRFDVTLSVALMRHLSDVHIGRVNPKNLSVGINVEPKKLDLAREVSNAIASGRIADVVRNAEPRFVQYRNLKAAYARYRAIAADTTLPFVTAPRRAVRVGEQFDGIGALRRRLVAFGDLKTNVNPSPTGAIYDAETAAGVTRFQTRNRLAADSGLTEATLAAINVSPAKRVRQLELALERIRWLPALDNGPFVVANVPSFQLYAFDSVGGSGAPAIQMNVVVGKADVGRETPMFERNMSYIIFRPYWVITPSIIRNETLPAVRRDRGYLARNDMEIYSGDGDSGPGLPATTANLARVASGDLGIRQRPGARNSLGLAKFIFPNDHNVYFHGTPATELFSRSKRDFSHGCIRLEDPAALATWILRDPRNWSRQQVEQAMKGANSRRVNLVRQIPVVIYYTTAVVWPDGEVGFFDDVYKHDARLESVLAKGYPFAP
jgi:murein L,D-transpeptidase YcbB/YkuD